MSLSKRGRAISLVAGLGLVSAGFGGLWAFGLLPTSTHKSPLSLVVETDGGVALEHRDDRFKVNGRANTTIDAESGQWVNGGKLEDEDGEVYLGQGLAGKWEPKSTKHIAWNGAIYSTDENTFLGQRVVVPGDWIQRTLDVHNVSPCSGWVTVYVGLDHYLHEDFSNYGPWRVNSDDASVHGLDPWAGSIPGGTDLAEHVELFWNLKGVPQCLAPWADDPLLNDPQAWSTDATLQEHATRPPGNSRECTMVPMVSGASPEECPGQWPVAVKTLLADPDNRAEFPAAGPDTISCAASLEYLVDEAVRMDIETNPLLTDAQRVELYRHRLLFGLTTKTDHALDAASYAKLNNPSTPMDALTWQQLLAISARHGIPMHGWAGIVAQVATAKGVPIDLTSNIPLVPIAQAYMPKDAIQPVTFGKRVDLMLDHHHSESDGSGGIVHDDSVLAFDLYVELECDADLPASPEVPLLNTGQRVPTSRLFKTGISLAGLLAAGAVLLFAWLARRRREREEQLIVVAPDGNRTVYPLVSRRNRRARS